MLSDAAEIAGDTSRAGVLDRVSHLANATSSVFSALITVANFKNLLSMKKTDPESPHTEHGSMTTEKLRASLFEGFSGNDEKRKAAEILIQNKGNSITHDNLKELLALDLDDSQKKILGEMFLRGQKEKEQRKKPFFET